MKVVLKEEAPFGPRGPQKGDVGDALYYRYDPIGGLFLEVLFYGYPGTYHCYDEMVESIVKEL